MEMDSEERCREVEEKRAMEDHNKLYATNRSPRHTKHYRNRHRHLTLTGHIYWPLVYIST